jgi:hypothetical protein
MGKRVIRLNESDLKNIVKKVISEQTQDKNLIKGIIKEQDISVQKNNDGKIIINGQKYKLQVKKGILGWIGVDIDDLIQTNDGWKVTASVAGISKTDIVPKDTISIIYKNLGQPTIDLGGKEPKRLVKA